jgi:hypothetical protein
VIGWLLVICASIMEGLRYGWTDPWIPIFMMLTGMGGAIIGRQRP